MPNPFTDCWVRLANKPKPPAMFVYTGTLLNDARHRRVDRQVGVQLLVGNAEHKVECPDPVNVVVPLPQLPRDERIGLQSARQELVERLAVDQASLISSPPSASSAFSSPKSHRTSRSVSDTSSVCAASAQIRSVKYTTMDAS